MPNSSQATERDRLRNLHVTPDVPRLSMGIVRYEGLSPKVAKQNRVAFGLLAGMFSLGLIAMIIGREWGSVLFLMICLMLQMPMLAIQLRSEKNAVGKGAFVSEEGVGALADGEVAWMLKWKDYGGFQHVQLQRWEQLLHPERRGLEVLDRNGIAVGTLPLLPGIEQGSLCRFELIHPVPRALLEKFPRESPLFRQLCAQPRRMSKRAAQLSLVGSMGLVWVGFDIIGIMLRNATSGQPHWTVQIATPFGAIGLLLALSGLVVFAARSAADLWYHVRPASPTFFEVPAPAEGPTELDFLLATSGGAELIELMDGVRYRYVHPELGEWRLGREAESLAFLGYLALAVWLSPLYLWPILSAQGRIDPWVLIIFPLLSLPFVLAAAANKRSVAARRGRLHDTIIKHDGQITVVHRDGTYDTFSPRARWKRDPVRETDVLIEGGRHYPIDRRRLYAFGSLLQL